MAHTESKKVVNPSKRIVKLVPHVEAMLEDEGYDAEQIRLACQSAVNDVSGVEQPADIGSMRHAKRKSIAKWRETTQTQYEVKAASAYDFLVWHDQLAELFEDHGVPHGDLTYSFVPAFIHVWLAGIKKRAADKASKKAQEAKDAAARANTPGPVDRTKERGNQPASK